MYVYASFMHILYIFHNIEGYLEGYLEGTERGVPRGAHRGWLRGWFIKWPREMLLNYLNWSN